LPTQEKITYSKKKKGQYHAFSGQYHWLISNKCNLGEQVTS